MRVIVMHNPRSGRGQAGRLSARIVARLRADGHDVEGVSAVARGQADLSDAGALVLIGGDGTVSYATDAAIEARVPVYHAGTGNENLFARTFGMRRSPEAVAAAVAAARIGTSDIVRVRGRPVLMMLSVGIDSGVIHRVAATRQFALGHFAYVEPVARAIVRPHLPPVTVVVDGRVLAHNEPGQLIIANTRAYALGIDPARGAAPTTGRLHAAFVPARSAARVACAFGALRLGSQPKALRTDAGTRAVVLTSEPMHPQADGEAWVLAGPGSRSPNGQSADQSTEHRLEAMVEPGSLRVLLPGP
ncbi:MAG: diacylglycerol kinase family protein [Planctomycetota bacterium]